MVPRQRDKLSIPVRARRLIELELVRVANPDAPRAAWSLHVPSPIWDAVRGEERPAPAAGLRLVPWATLVVAAAMRPELTIAACNDASKCDRHALGFLLSEQAGPI